LLHQLKYSCILYCNPGGNKIQKDTIDINKKKYSSVYFFFYLNFHLITFLV
jgi:hypothetical protein